MTEYIQTIITLSEGASYDNMKFDPKYSDTIYVQHCKFRDIKVLNDILFQSKNNEQFRKVKEVIDETTFSNTTINFECCSGCFNKQHEYYLGVSEKNQKDMWDFINNCMKVGVKLVFADFSLKSLIGSWNKYADKDVYGEIPIKQIGSIEGNIKVVSNEDKLQDCPLFQLKHACDLSRKIKKHIYLGVHTLSDSIVYDLINRCDDFEIVDNNNTNKNQINVLSQWYIDKDEFKYKYIDEIPSSELLPCHAVITINGLSGQILISQCHLNELTKIDPDYTVVAQKYANENGISFKEALLIPAPVMAEYTQTQVKSAPPVTAINYCKTS
jgi:hypothetical protein